MASKTPLTSNSVMCSKKRRNPNWEDGEKALLRECLRIYTNIIEDKNNDTNTNKAKTNAWKSVLQNFNEANTRGRTLEEIKSQWRVLKQTAKRSQFEYKKACRSTGGGPKPPSPPPEINEIIEMIPNEFTYDENNFDSDYKENTNPKTDTEKPDQPEFVTVKKKNILKKSPKKVIQSNDVFEGKIRRDTETLKLIKEEHDIKIQLMKEKHEWERIEHELRKKNLELQNIILKRQLEEM